MEVDDLIAVLDAQLDLPTVVDRLGTYCVDNREDVRSDQYAAQASTCRILRQTMAKESFDMWHETGAPAAGVSQLLRDQMAQLDMTPALAVVTVLEGLCFGAARVYFANASSTVRIKRGAVLPLPERWLGDDFPGTPSPAAVHPNLLDESCNFVLWDVEAEVELDYRYRDLLDFVCSSRAPDKDRKDKHGQVVIPAYKLPRIASVHPFAGNEMGTRELDFAREKFFGVRRGPSYPDASLNSDDLSVDSDHQRVFDALAMVGNRASIAVLPEFCLHRPDGIRSLLVRYDRRLLPDLVVAGSAHEESADAVRANTAHVYLAGNHILTVSKQQPFAVRRRADDGRDQFRLEEDLAPLPLAVRLATGTTTRLGVAICSDLNSQKVLDAMKWAGVNLLLSPSWTPRSGIFPSALDSLAGACQCVGLIANTPGHALADKRPGDEPFWALSAVPRERDNVGYHEYEGVPPAVGILDPNLAPSDEGYWEWVPLSGEES